MNIFFLDTSTDYAICGICREDRTLVTSLARQHDRQLSVQLYPMIEEVLGSAGIGRSEIDAFSVGLGPGSFTGVRVAVTTMRTLAQVMRKPLVAVGTLDALAESARISSIEYADSSVLAIAPSRRGEAYAAQFGPTIRTSEASAISYTLVQLMASELEQIDVVAGPSSILAALFPDGNRHTLFPIEHPDPQAIANLTALQIAIKRWRDPLSLDPLYVAPPAVSQHKQIAAAAVNADS